MIKKRHDGTYEILNNGLPYHVLQTDPIFAEVDSYAQAHPDEVEIVPAPPGPTLEESKETLRAAINTERNRREMGGFTYLDKTFDSDQTSVTRINAAVNTAVAAILTISVFSVEWTCKDNSTIALDAQQFLGLASALAQHSNAQHVRGRGLKDQTEAAQSEADLVVVENLLNEWKAEA
jgi:hypothetical protein